ncbi:uncharacterized protein N7482_003929 [Penicillium canariense]|uniref:Uncharacterized protein n=1 Tax=Penicillium canariense TaxID=189055 RepID=A0A9W9I859_9EURO|nr:uncharacterized protein N7482_003929 [Penicillium canariense]KAJ5168335.1 hypothetical protein N7482_003929 [Penicillium canariense]
MKHGRVRCVLGAELPPSLVVGALRGSGGETVVSAVLSAWPGTFRFPIRDEDLAKAGQTGVAPYRCPHPLKEVSTEINVTRQPVRKLGIGTDMQHAWHSVQKTSEFPGSGLRRGRGISCRT